MFLGKTTASKPKAPTPQQAAAASVQPISSNTMTYVIIGAASLVLISAVFWMARSK